MKLELRKRHKNSGRPPEKDAPKFCEWMRKTHGCVFQAAGGCEGKIEAMHLDFAGGKGVATKVADRFTLPACSAHHGLQHNKGWQTFMRMMGVTADQLLNAAAKLWTAWPGRPAWERKRAA